MTINLFRVLVLTQWKMIFVYVYDSLALAIVMNEEKRRPDAHTKFVSIEQISVSVMQNSKNSIGSCINIYINTTWRWERLIVFDICIF